MSALFQSLPRWLIDATWQGSLAILLVWLVNPWVRRLLGAQAAYLLWGLVLLRLLIPWQPESPFQWGSPRLSLPEVRQNGLSPLRITITTEEIAPEDPKEVAPLSARRTRVPMALLVWWSGIALVLGLAVIRSSRAAWLARRARDVSADPRLEELREALALPKLPVRETAELRSPALTGLFRPIILLPIDWRERLSAEDLRCILTHEIGHHTRRDLCWRWAFLVARAVHWFNPLVWLAERAARTDQEMACDEWVLRHDRKSSAQGYGEALLVSAQKLGAPQWRFSVQADMAESRAGLRKRIAFLGRIKPRGWMALLGGALLVVLLLIVTGPARREVAPQAALQPAPVIPAPAARKSESVAEGKPAEAQPARKANVLIEVKVLEIPPDLVSGELNSGAATDGTVTVQATYSREKLAEFLRAMAQKDGVEFMSEPSVTTRSGQRCIIQVVREFRYPSEFEQPTGDILKTGWKVPLTPVTFETKPLGVTVECRPTARRDGRIDLSINPRVVEFEGFIDFAGTRGAKQTLQADALSDRYQASEGGTMKQPIFATREVSSQLTVRSGETVVLGGITSDFRKVKDSLEAGEWKEPPVKRMLFVFLTATELRADGLIRNVGAAQSAAILSHDGEKFFGVPVPGRPDLMISPYASEAGYVKVKGYSPGEEIKDPFSGQPLLVPRAETDQGAPAAIAGKLIISTLELKGVGISEAVGQLKAKSAELASAENGASGLNIVLNAPAPDFEESHPITLSLANVSVREALRQIASKAGLVVEEEPYALVIKAEEMPELCTKVYRVPRAFLDDLPKLDAAQVKEYWKSRGIAFPAGASIAFVNPVSLISRNTMREQARLGALFLAQQGEDGIRPRVVSANEEADKPPAFAPAATKPPTPDGEFKLGEGKVEDVGQGAFLITQAIHFIGKGVPDVSQMKVVGTFFERTKDGKLQLAQGKLRSKWLTAPVDWKAGAAETLSLRYEPKDNEGRSYAGYLISVYYKKMFQGAAASSEELRREYPPEVVLQ